MFPEDFHAIDLIHQILIVDGFALPERLPSHVALNTSQLKYLYPQASHVMWSGEAIRAFIARHFAAAILDAFDQLGPYAYKADLARYCILYVQGGMYIDLGMRLINQWRIPGRCGLAAFRDFAFASPSWTIMQNAIIWARPGRPEFKLAIEAIVENCRLRYYGPNSLYPTGPVLFGKMCAAAMAAKSRQPDADDQWIGETRGITPESSQRNMAFVAPDLALIAIRTKDKGGDLKEMGLSATNNYAAIWASGQAYGERVRQWSHQSSAISLLGVERSAHGIIIPAGRTGRVTYGPYIPLDPGVYELTLEFAEGTRFSRLQVEIMKSAGQEPIDLCDYSSSRPVRHERLNFEFRCEATAADVEFRLVVHGDFDGALCSMMVMRKEDV